MKKTKKIHSSFWLGDKLDLLEKAEKLNPFELAAYKRSISNFVQILTGKNVPVKFEVNGDSYTDGDTVTISSTINQKHFDSIVGLALHEASHILLTDFSVLKTFYVNVSKILQHNGMSEYDANQKVSFYNFDRLKALLNYVEDRRIDRYVYRSAPGYRNYYESLYQRYFNSSVIGSALESTEYRTVDWDSYMFRIINFTNPKSELDALPNLEKIHKIIFGSVPALKSTTDALTIAMKVYDFIELCVKEEEQKQSQSSNASGQNDENSTESPSNEGGQDGDENGSQSDQNGSDGNGRSNEKERKELTKNQKKSLEKAIKKQDKFLDGNIAKKKVSKKMNESIEAASKADITDHTVEYDTGYSRKKTDVKVINGLNDSILELMGMRWKAEYMEDVVSEGFRLGKKLGKKLQIRNYERNTEFNRQKKGKLDKRRIYSLGMNDREVFKKIMTEKFADAFIHLTIDNSGSMSGDPFKNAMISAVAIAKMGSMTNIDVQISLRSAGSNLTSSHTAYIWNVYDSRKDSLNVIKKYFPQLKTDGVTPEGLTFEALMKLLPTGTDSLKTYFINYSDGAPYFEQYSGESAWKHTKSQVDILRKNGYNILSFFVQSYYTNETERKAFTTMYGKDASFIDPTSLKDVAKVLQKKFEKA